MDDEAMDMSLRERRNMMEREQRRKERQEKERGKRRGRCSGGWEMVIG